jgi:peptidoglycan/xylan/chitin deacetylase (PgdA/CDA1 family)
MFANIPFNGSSLPEKTLCLTFDDGPGETPGNGPGPKTLRLAQYLHTEKIRATFFMVGKHIEQFPSIVPEVARLGHVIGNHTYHHEMGLPKALATGSDIVSEISMTDALIKPYNPNNKIHFRAPWGQWDEQVASTLNQHLPTNPDHIGPFHWDIESSDWRYWRDGQTAEECAAAYLATAQQINKGIILMHDSTADIPQARANNRTFETIKLLVPKLKSLGYQFVGLDEIQI